MRDIKCKPKAKCRVFSEAVIYNEQELPSNEKICLELFMKGCALQLHHLIMTLSFTDPLRTNIYERSAAGHRQSDTCLFTSLARFSPAACITGPSGHNSEIKVRKNQVMGSF